MNKTRIILALTMMLTILTTTTTTASAKFVGIAGSSGSSQLLAGQEAEFAVNTTSLPIFSSKAPDTWRIQDSKANQNLTKAGQHLDLEISFNEPHVKVPGTGDVNLKINNPIEYQVVQLSSTKFDVLISKEILISLSNLGVDCTITIPANEANKQLTKILATKKSAGLTEIISTVAGITNNATGTQCAANGVTAGKVGTFNQTTIEHGVETV